MPYDNLLLNPITYEMLWDRHVHKRSVLSFFDRLSAIGGLFGALTPICAAIVGYVHFRSEYLYIMRELFVDPVAADSSGPKSKKQLEIDARKELTNRT